MSATFRLATFNCENLYGRPKIFGETKVTSMKLLDKIGELQNELTKEKFDHDKIKALKADLKGYVTINDIRGKHTKAKGVNEWFGWIEFSRQAPNEEAVLNTARVINDVDADILCAIEVENRISLKRFHNQLLWPKYLNPDGKPKYEYIMLIDGNDNRGIDVSIMSRFPIDWIRSHIHDRTMYYDNETHTFSRDCLEAQIILPSKESMLLLVNHLKSLGYNSGKDRLGNVRRLGQVKRIVEIVDEHNLDHELLAIVGDFNAPADNESVKPLLEKDGLYNVNLELDPDKRGTYRTGKKQLDYIVVSKALKDKLEKVHIERRGVFTTTNKWVPYDTVKNRKTEASDHAVVVADFKIN
jgi:endonuclease/exonuclease/phosphatase family metal-dependent hydrolase